jgi:hypothetical protein
MPVAATTLLAVNTTSMQGLCRNATPGPDKIIFRPGNVIVKLDNSIATHINTSIIYKYAYGKAPAHLRRHPETIQEIPHTMSVLIPLTTKR